jgi:hypothetical protein
MLVFASIDVLAQLIGGLPQRRFDGLMLVVLPTWLFCLCHYVSVSRKLIDRLLISKYSAR